MSLVPVSSWSTHHIPHLTDMHLYLSIPLDPALPLPFLEPLVIWLFPGAPQILPLCLSLDQLLLCLGLQEKEEQVSSCSTTTLAVPAGGWTLCLESKPMWATVGKELGPTRASDKSLKFKRRDSYCSVFWWWGSFQKDNMGRGVLELLQCKAAMRQGLGKWASGNQEDINSQNLSIRGTR